MRIKIKKLEMKWTLLLGLLLFQIVVSAYPKKLSKTKSDWMTFDSYNFSGNSTGYTFKGDMYFTRNRVEVDIKKDTVIFKKNGYFKTNPKKLPKTKSDWMTFDSYNFSGNSTGYTFKGDMYFTRNGVEVDIKKDTVIFKKNGYFKTNSALIKLEQNKLFVFIGQELTNLNYEADKVVEIENKIYLTGSASLEFSNKSTFKANEIIIEKE